MFEITLGNWMPPCRALVENVNEWFGVFFILHKLVIGLSVLAVINGVFIQETFKVAAQDDWLMTTQKERLARTHGTKMRALFKHLDRDQNDHISFEEFLELKHEPRVRTWLSAMEIEVNDLGKVFKLLDQHRDGKLTMDELVCGAARLKGVARNLDVAFLLQKVELYHNAVCHLSSQFSEMSRHRGFVLSEGRLRQGKFSEMRSHSHGRHSQMRSEHAELSPHTECRRKMEL
jgi:hypothetical protein